MVKHRINSGHFDSTVCMLRWLSGIMLAPYAVACGFKSSGTAFWFYFALSLKFSTYSVESYEKLQNCTFVGL